MFWTLAFRNIFRNKIRSLITLSAIAFGGTALILAAGFIEDCVVRMQEYYIRAFIGHVRIARQGYFEKGLKDPYQYMIEDPARLISKIRSIPGVQEVTPRIEFSGLLSDGPSSLSFLAQAIEPQAESRASENFQLIEGQNLSGSDAYGVILGRGMAESLGVHAGNSVTLVTNTVAGGLNAMDMKVTGVFQTMSKAFDDHALRVVLPTGQKLLRTPNIQTLTVFLSHTADTDRVRGELMRLFKDEHQPLDIRPWSALPESDFVVKVTPFYHSLFRVLRIIILSMVILSIFNTMNMSVYERVGEIGTIAALGDRRREIVRLFLAEGLLLGTLGAGLGLVAALLLGRLISWIGIPMPIAPGTTVQWFAKILIMPNACVSACLLVIAVAVASAYHPALKASRLEIADALRHNI